MPLNDSTARLTSDGCTKIEEPTMVPTTIAVAWVNPIVRASFVDIGCFTRSSAGRIVSSAWRRLAGHLLIDRLNRRKCVRVGRRLVVSVPFDPREAEREPAGILRAGLDLVERDFGDDLGPDEDRVGVAADLDLEKLLRLPREHLVGEPLERLAEHDEAAVRGVPRPEMQVAERPSSSAAAPFGGEDHEVERPRLLHLQPRGATTAGSVHAV